MSLLLCIADPHETEDKMLQMCKVSFTFRLSLLIFYDIIYMHLKCLIIYELYMKYYKKYLTFASTIIITFLPAIAIYTK